MKAPAFQLYADDLIAGTIKFTDAELGLYMRLLCAQWSEGSLTDDDGELRSYGRGKTPLDRVKAKFQKGPDGRLRNARMEIVRAEQNKFRLARQIAGSAGGKKRAELAANAKQTPSKTQAELERSPSISGANTVAKSSSPSPSPSPSIKNHKASAKPEAGRFTPEQTALTKRLHEALNSEWENDRQKWMGRVKNQFNKTARVTGEIESAIKEGRIKTTPARYAEQIWKEFK